MKATRPQSWMAVLPTLMLPVISGLVLFWLLFAMIDRGVIENEALIRYLAGHPVSKVTTAMFLIGLCSLAMVGNNVFDQFSALRRISLSPTKKKKRGAETTGAADDDETIAEGDRKRSEQLLQRLFQVKSRLQSFYLWKRLHQLLNHVMQNDGAEGLEHEFKYLADVDADLKHDRYSLVRILVWATPMLGFLGTVLGISEALGGIAVGPDNNFQQMMTGLRGSLYVAFDTTALALTFAIVLMFIQFVVERFETQLLTSVDQISRLEMGRYFKVTAADKDPYVRSVELIGKRVLQSSESLLQQQVELWRTSIDAAQEAWIDSNQMTHTTVQQNLESAVGASTESLSRSLSQSIEKADVALERRMEQWQVAFSNNARQVAEQQSQLAAQTQSMNEIMHQLGELAEIQNQLTGSIQSLPAEEIATATERLTEAIAQLEERLERELQQEEKTNTRRFDESDLPVKIINLESRRRAA